MAGVHADGTLARRWRGLGLSLALALTLSIVPLQGLAAAAHDPVSSGAGMGSRAPVMLETGARMVAAGSAAGVLRLAGAPPPGAAASAPGRHGAGRPGRLAPRHPRASRLAALGRLQLEGG